MSAEAAAALVRVKELEDKLKALEAEKAAAATKAEEAARKKVEAQAAARGQAVDPEKVARAQEEARKKAQAEQDRKAEQDRRRLEAEQKAAQAQLAEEKRKADEAARLAAAAAATTLPPAPSTTVAVAAATPPPAPPPTAAAAPPSPAIKPGTLVDLSEPGVISPVAITKPTLAYPPIALRQRIEGKVDLSVLVDERGVVTDAKVVAAAGGKAGLNEAASEYVRRWKFRPATKDGVAVKTWTPVSVVFVLPR
ncbi:MAG: hypothetical protein DMF78_20130 [Acidobacteria bacterium]|nr:MAG: hypothetical protein DMF78_20130 [Acidobacteriota bacterium]